MAHTEEAYLTFHRSVECLVSGADALSSTYGAADFSLANKLTVASQGRLRLCPIRGNELAYLPWNSSRAFCSKDIQFLVVQTQTDTPATNTKQFAYHLTRSLAYELAGKPEGIIDCGSVAIFSYEGRTLVVD